MLVASLATSMLVDQVGGKAFSLQRLIAAGWRVPAGFVVTTEAFRLLPFDGMLPEENERDVTIPCAIVEAVRSALDQLGTSKALAVRSSAVGEDSREAAFAGLLETRLQVPSTLDDVLAALVACWRSYGSRRVLEYQRTRGTTLRGMAVLVQQMVDGEYSGVMFTRHPAPTKEQVDANSLLVEYCVGLGENLVSGRVTPWSLSVARSPRESIDVLSTERDESVNTPSKCAPSQTIQGGLPASVVETLVDAADELERLFGGPQDVEWTCDAEGTVSWLQSRPVTTMVARREGQEGPSPRGRRQRWTNANLNENYPDPVSPLLASLAPQCYYHYFRNLGLALGVSPRRVEEVELELRSLVGTHAGRLYYNLSNIERVLAAAPFGTWLQSAFLDFIGAAEEDSSCEDDVEDDVVLRSTQGKRSALTSRVRDGLETARIGWRAWRLVRSLDERITTFEHDVQAYAEQAHPGRLATCGDDELLKLWRCFAEIRFHRWLPGSIADAASMVSYALLKRTLSREFPDSEKGSLHNGLLRGLRDVVSAKSAESLWEISRQVRANRAWMRWLDESSLVKDGSESLGTDPSLASLRDLLQGWLDRWGFRCSGELLLTIPSYQEQPETVVELLRTYVASDQESPAARLERQSRLRQEETERVLSELRTRRMVRGLPWPRRDAFVRRLIGATQQAIVCRERARLQQALLYQRLRRLVLEMGRRWTQRRIVAAPEDLFFLTWQEVESLFGGGSPAIDPVQALIRARRAQWEHDRTLHPPENLVLRRGESWHEVDASRSAASENKLSRTGEADGETVQRGMAACSGVVEGRACVMEDVRQVDRLQRGDILVVRQTDPGWATVFPLVRGLVMERGGMLSHGAILAREYGLPTVVGIADATTRYADAPRIRVDGDRGEVHALSDVETTERPPLHPEGTSRRNANPQGTDA